VHVRCRRKEGSRSLSHLLMIFLLLLFSEGETGEDDAATEDDGVMEDEEDEGMSSYISIVVT